MKLRILTLTCISLAAFSSTSAPAAAQDGDISIKLHFDPAPAGTTTHRAIGAVPYIDFKPDGRCVPHCALTIERSGGNWQDTIRVKVYFIPAMDREGNRPACTLPRNKFNFWEETLIAEPGEDVSKQIVNIDLRERGPAFSRSDRYEGPFQLLVVFPGRIRMRSEPFMLRPDPTVNRGYRNSAACSVPAG